MDSESVLELSVLQTKYPKANDKPVWSLPRRICRGSHSRKQSSPMLSRQLTSAFQGVGGSCLSGAISTCTSQTLQNVVIQRAYNRNSVPSIIKHLCQNTLTAHWTQRLPIIQSQPPAALAADLLSSLLTSVDDPSYWKIIDFCSGAGGPTPYIEQHLNRKRQSSGLNPISFLLSDLYPNLDAWIQHSSHSENLGFIPQAVDATNPPFAAISCTTPGDKQAAFDQGFEHDGRKVFRLFCLSFHHFDDEGAKRVLKSTMETSDAFAIIELQDRRIGSLMLMVLEFWLLLAIMWIWFWQDWAALLCTYLLPVLPAIHAFDGFVSCLRTRTFSEVVQLVDEVLGRNSQDLKGTGVTAVRGDWTFTSVRTLHTWPIGYLNAVVGRRVSYGSSEGGIA